MCFFQIDLGWIKCLLEGACSVGRSSTREQLVDEILGNRFLNFASKLASGLRRRPGDAAETAPTPVNWPLEGFLLRSPLVAGWQGLEMEAWETWDEKSKTGKPLMPLRIDRLAPDVMICIFNGAVSRIEVRQPPEGMHFGAQPDSPGQFSKACLAVC